MEVTARIPLQQYGYMEIKGTDAELEKIEALYTRYAEKPIVFRGATEPKRKLGASKAKPAGVECVTFTGETIYYDEAAHVYTTKDGQVLTSASAYAKQFEEHFDKERILPLCAKKRGVDADQLGASWDMNGELSRLLGTTLHKAMESWFKFRAVGGVSKHPLLKAAVETFPDKDANVLSEVRVSDVANLRAGQIDGLELLGEKRARILDFKTDADVKKHLERHWHQLSFYAAILQAHGWTIEGLRIWNYTDRWEKHDGEVLPLCGS